jgi:hypothetical protein
LRKPHDLPPHVTLGDLADQPPVLLGEAGGAVFLDCDSDFVQPLDVDLGEVLAAGQGQQLRGKIDSVERGLLAVLLPVVVDDDLDPVRTEKIAERPELLERNAGRDGAPDGGD